MKIGLDNGLGRAFTVQFNAGKEAFITLQGVGAGRIDMALNKEQLDAIIDACEKVRCEMEG